MKKVLITGARGFVAQNIAKSLREAGFYIIGTSRQGGDHCEYDELCSGTLGRPLERVFQDHEIEAVIHCAFDQQDKDNSTHESGTRLWADQAAEAGVKMQVFMSSISASEDAFASYGQKKYLLEQWFLARGQIVLRLGLVIGEGGIFGRIISMVRKSPVIPLIDGGRTLTYITDRNVIGKFINQVLQDNQDKYRGKAFNLHQKEPVLFVDILRAIKKKYGASCILVPIPYIIVSAGMAVLDKLKFLKLSFDSNNLKGMRQNNGKNFHSDVNALGYGEPHYEDLIGQ
ncbi:MAG: NAD-dependent epimerase/dehydratase family protein [Nitrospira sp.]|nr:NAD-dependent epimerase/dehydratase family protein [Nitrospira sp.]